MKSTKKKTPSPLPLRYLEVVRNISDIQSERNQWFWREVYRNKKPKKKNGKLIPGNITAMGGGYDSKRIAVEAVNKYNNRLKVKLKVVK